ncbi:asparagine synthase (glutamine-hydrolyzing) [Streptomyces sp. PSAA01]|uniref:asparagine synthase (glutamine-hydrolyzing) n=1 Tax=Streptomyces sp. PSAA01 TaxID=2912762 RepID=UPI001F0239FD|nr:asparagine synthase (glutamine-hydrolyzing) [Streptomyces sp. PSAA01]MCG0286197.1 asparagine synthase (glutamine-hydrolyzing) [Streptomyces sp. PSAA01]
MCGIAGWVDWKIDLREHRATLESMTQTMGQRGPDAIGVWMDPHVGLGHRRLSIVDLRGGAQPFVVRDTALGASIAITYNGEVYNYRDIRAQLRGRGHIFRTRSDTEVLIRAYIEWGEKFVERLEGMFAFGIWDGRSGELILARDRLGVKPLFYSETPAGFLFGSEPKVIISRSDFDAALDSNGLAELFAMVTAPTPGEFPLQGISELRPGWMMRISKSRITKYPYWRLTSRPHVDGRDETIRMVRELLERAVLRQLGADVPVGVLLSGGVDSSAIAELGAAAYELRASTKMRSYSVDFQSSADHYQRTSLHHGRDTPYAIAAAAHVGTDHTNVLLDVPELLDAGRLGMRARDRPGFGDADISFYLLCRKLAADGVRVALAGEAGDELFGGYPQFRAEAAEPTTSFPWYGRFPNGLAGLLAPELVSEIKPDEYVEQRYEEAIGEVPRLQGENAVDRRIREVTYLYLTRMLPFLLDRVDRLSMAAGVEVRVPFCEHLLVEYTWNVPWRLRDLASQDGLDKGLLRRAVADVLPSTIVNRPKSAYPILWNPKYLEVLGCQVEEVIDDQSSLLYGILDRGRVLSLARGEESPSAAIGRGRSLAFLLQLDQWGREYHVQLGRV